jgi:cystathionine beta-lyase
MKYNFDIVHERRGTNSIKWDYAYFSGILQSRNLGEGTLASDEIIPMWVADMDFQTAQPIVDAIIRRAKHGIFGYTLPTDSYFDAIIKWMNERQGWKAEKEWILTTSGVLPTISLAVQTFTAPGDKVILQTPVFKPFYQTIEDNGRVLVRNPLIYKDGQYSMNFKDLEQKASDPRARMIILCNPHNPVGRAWNHQELEQLGRICNKHDLLIISDEIHSNLIYSWSKFTSMAAVDKTFFDRLIICNSPTKTFNTPGIKTSTTFVPDKNLRERLTVALNNLNEHFSASLFGTLVVQIAYEQGGEWLDQAMGYIEGNFTFLNDYFSNHLPTLRVVRPDALYLIWIDCRALKLSPADFQNLFINDAKVYLEEGSKYGTEGEGFIRLNIACPRSVLVLALNRIRAAIENQESNKGESDVS